MLPCALDGILYFLYQPSLGIFISFICAASNIIKKYSSERLFSLISTLIICLLSLFTILRNQVWQSEVSLWSDAAVKSPKKARVHYNLGVSYSYINKKDLAEKEFETTISLNPFYTNAYYNLANIYETRNDTDKAKIFYMIGLKLDPANNKVKEHLDIISKK
jgi:tetratricopeptide (TPR) repeat protein